MISAFSLTLIFSIALCVHVVRTGAPIWWLLIILLGFPPLGGIVYLLVVVLPGLAGGPSARRLSASARAALDPGREYRQAKTALAEAATVANQLRLAKAAQAQGRHEEAEALFAQAAQGVHAEDPVLLLGRAQSLIELGRFDEADRVMQNLELSGEEAHAPAATLAVARIREGEGRMAEAERGYREAAERLPGLEGIGRYAAFLARTGRAVEARETIAEMDRRIARANPQFRREGRVWRDLARAALARA